ncbi:MAG: acyltransferase [Planctomycetota bacterium]|jgi:acetyltransferase-like isoleucine patch superfamily enzyme
MPRKSHGSGQFEPSQFARLGDGVVIEPGVLVFHPENIILEDDVYVGHYTILKGYYKNRIIIGAGTWIGQQCFFHGAGGLTVGKNVGIGPGVKIITSAHAEEGREKPILHSRIEFAPVVIEDDVDIGLGAIILMGVTVGRGAQIGAGAVLSQDVPPYAVSAGVPAKVLRMREG